MSTTTLERSQSCTSSTSLSMSSPRPSVQRATTPPGSEPSLDNLHDRINQLDSRVLELRSTVLTKDGYVDRRNREDEHIRREFENHRAISHRIDLNVVALRSDVEQIKTSIFQLKSSLGQTGSETVFLREDVDRLQRSVDHLQQDSEKMGSDLFATRIDVSKLESASSQLRTDLLTLEHKMSSGFNALNSRMEAFESRMARYDNSEQYGRTTALNSKVQYIHFNLQKVPAIREDHSIEWPEYFPKTPWRFWCLKKRSRVHRLVELVEFYRLGDDDDIRAWSRFYSGDCPTNESESETEEEPIFMTRAEAVRRFPVAAHKALACFLGLDWENVRKRVEEDPHLAAQRPPKRQQEDVASASTKSRSKHVKMARRPTVSDVQRLVYGGGSISEEKSSKSEEQDVLGWCPFPPLSEDSMSKLRSHNEPGINAMLDAINKGRLQVKPSASEKARMSPTRSKASHTIGHAAAAASRSEQGEIPTGRNTIPTEPMTSLASEAGPASEPDVPGTASGSDGSAS